MPIRIDKKLPAVEILRTENIFVMDDQTCCPPNDIRPLKILIFKSYATKNGHRKPSCCAIWLIRPYN